MLDFQKKALRISLLLLAVTCAAMGEKSQRQSSTRRPNGNNTRLTSTRRGSAPPPPPHTTWYPPPNTTWYPPPNTTNETSTWSDSTQGYTERSTNYYFQESTTDYTTEEPTTDYATETSIPTTRATTTTTTAAATTEIPSTTTTPTTTGVTTQKPSVEMNPEEIMSAASATIEKAELGLYKEKTRMSLSLMNEVLPKIQDLQTNMIGLMKSSDGPSPISFSAFKENDEILQKEMSSLEARLDQNRFALQQYNEEYKKMEDQLQITHEALRNMLMSADGHAIGKTADTTKILTGCGGNLSSSGGSINYKERQAVESKENCIWTISTDAPVTTSTTELTVTLRKAGFTPCYETYLAIGYFPNSEYLSEISWAKFNATSHTQTMKITAPVAFVHFVMGQCRNSMSSNNKGFQLDFAFTSPDVLHVIQPSSGPPMDYKYTNIFLNQSSGSLRYPQNGQATYAALERVSIVIQPTVPNANFRLKWYRTEQCCDRISLLSYRTSSVGWLRIGPFSGERMYTTDYRFDGLSPMIVTFQSDASSNSAGFEIMYYNN